MEKKVMPKVSLSNAWFLLLLVVCISSSALVVPSEAFLLRQNILYLQQQQQPQQRQQPKQQRQQPVIIVKTLLRDTLQKKGNKQIFRNGGCFIPLFAQTTRKEEEEEDNDDDTAAVADVKGVTLKIAIDKHWSVAELSPDDGDIGRFTCGESLDLVHRLRYQSDAVLVGRGTVETDDCSLTVRRGFDDTIKQPVRVVLDPRLSLLQNNNNEKKSYRLFSDNQAPTIVYHSVPNYDKDNDNNKEQVVQLVYLEPDDGNNNTSNNPHSNLNVQNVLTDLKDNHSVEHVMVEGGPQTAEQFLKHDLVDRCMIIQADGVEFRNEPLSSRLSREQLTNRYGFQLLQSVDCGRDTVHYYTKTNTAWPTTNVWDWP